MKKNIVSTTWLLVNTCICFGQAKVTTGKENTSAATSSCKVSGSYLSNSVYQGRKDSSVVSYITPSISYINKHGWNITGSLSYAPNPGINEIELITFEASYEHKFTNSFSANTYGSAYFYNQFSSSVQSEKKIGFGVGFDYSPKDIINLSADAGVSFSANPDIATTVSIGHPFYFGNDGHDLSVIPAVTVIAGTQNYYRNYYTNRRFNQSIRAHGKKPRANGNTTNNSNTDKKINIVSVRSFNILDYELSAPVTYDEKKWGLFFTPTYAIPVHPLTYTEEGSATLITEKLMNIFYFQIGGYIKF